MGWKVKTFTFCNCHLQDNFSQQLSLLNLQGLRKLEVLSDFLGNKGLTKIFKIDLPALEIFAFGNTDITNDGLKVLQKNVGRLKFFGFSDQKGINSLLFMRSAIKAYRSSKKLCLNMF